MSACAKRRYGSDIAAKTALAKLRWQDKPNHTEQRAYHCPGCRGWHLTSQPERVSPPEQASA